MAKTLKKFNGRGYGRDEHLYIAAYSGADACRMLSKLYSKTESYWKNELRIYFSECWGNPMEGVEVKRGGWVGRGYRNDTPVLVYNGEKE